MYLGMYRYTYSCQKFNVEINLRKINKIAYSHYDLSQATHIQLVKSHSVNGNKMFYLLMTTTVVYSCTILRLNKLDYFRIIK